jgi:hypothetical protein
MSRPGAHVHLGLPAPIPGSSTRWHRDRPADPRHRRVDPDQNGNRMVPRRRASRRPGRQHAGQMHRVDPVRHAARAPHVLALHPGGLAGLLLAGLVNRPDHQPAPPPAAARRFLQAGRREPADLAHCGERVPRCPVQQPLSPVRGPVPGMLRDRPPVALRHLTDQRRHILNRMLPRLRPDKARPKASHELSTFLNRPPSPYPGSSSRLRFICSHKHMIVRRLRPRHTNPASRQVKPPIASWPGRCPGLAGCAGGTSGSGLGGGGASSASGGRGRRARVLGGWRRVGA